MFSSFQTQMKFILNIAVCFQKTKKYYFINDWTVLFVLYMGPPQVIPLLYRVYLE